jgi:glutaredoxin 3
MSQVTIYVTTYCPYCTSAKGYLDRLGVPYQTVDVTHDADKRNWLRATTGMQTVPQIFVGDTSVGGFTDMRALDQQGGFRPMLDRAGIPYRQA